MFRNNIVIVWDFGKEITVTLQDALFTMTSLAVMTSAAVKEAKSDGKVVVRYTQEVTGATTMTLKQKPVGKVRWLDLDKGTRGQAAAETEGTSLSLTNLTGAAAGDRIKLFYDIEVDGSTGTAYEITIDAANFPGTYKVYGDTLVKNRNGKNSPYQFIINRAKVDSNVTFTMEAEGDPSVDFSNADVKAA